MVVNPVQFKLSYDTYDDGGSKPINRVTARTPETRAIVGRMTWNAREIRSLDVQPDFRRQGIATGMYEHAVGVASERAKVPMPKHSADRTDMGDAWARTVGGSLPRRSQWAGGQ